MANETHINTYRKSDPDYELTAEVGSYLDEALESDPDYELVSEGEPRPRAEHRTEIATRVWGEVLRDVPADDPEPRVHLGKPVEGPHWQMGVGAAPEGS